MQSRFAKGFRSALLIASLVVGAARSSNALIVSGNPVTDNYVAPVGAANPGWANLASSVSAIYLGDGWVIGARHSANGAPATISFDAGIFSVIPGTSRTISNAIGLQYVDHFNNGTVSSATTESDIIMYRIDSASQYGSTLEEQAAAQGKPVQQITIASTPPAQNASITLLATGQTRLNDSVTTNGSFSGYTVNTNNATSRKKAWGTNRISSDTVLPYESDAGITAVVRVSTGGGTVLRDTVSYFAQFDNLLATDPLTNESTVAAGDSGGGVFTQQAGNWVLLGHLHSFFRLENQPNNMAAFTGPFAFSDFTNPHYRSQIMDALGQTNYSLVGDINLDGTVSGNGSGPWESDDVKAFIDGWTAQASRSNPAADIVSWKMGDLNQDSVTDIADFLLLRQSLGAGGANLSLGSLLGGANPVPEPAGMATLALAGAAYWLYRRSSRTRQGV